MKNRTQVLSTLERTRDSCCDGCGHGAELFGEAKPQAGEGGLGMERTKQMKTSKA